MGGWGCPHEDQGKCQKVPGKTCDPGMKGCTLSGRFLFSTDDKNISNRLKDKKEQTKKARHDKQVSSNKD